MVCVGLYMHAQDNVKKAKTQTLIHEVVVNKYDFLHKVVEDDLHVLYPNAVFEIVETAQIDGTAHSVIKATSLIKMKKREIDASAEKIKEVKLHEYYIVNSSYLSNNTSEYTPREWDLRIGLTVIPVKLYAFHNDNGSLDFTSSSISQGASIGLAHQFSKRKSNLWMIYSFSMNFTKITPRRDDFINDSYEGNDLAALSPALGVSVNYRGAEFGLFVGKDFLPGTAAADWKLNGETWFSLTIGTSFNASVRKDK